MNNIDDLVPPLEMCKKIPEGAFADSALVHVVYSSDMKKKRLSIYVAVRDECYSGPVPPTVWEIYPAPTLQEIMNDLPDATVYKLGNRYCAGLINSSDDGISEDSAVVAALKLWFEVKK